VAAKKPADMAAGTDVAEVSDVDLALHRETFTPDTVRAATASYKGIDFIPDTWEEVAEAFGGEVLMFEGSPWKVVDKDTLIGVPFMICDVKVSWSTKYDSPFVNILALTKDNEKIVINDGSTGIMEQMLHMLNKSKRKAGIVCEGGLRKSDYPVTIHDGMSDTDKVIEATTYYIA
jgi:hypothetical protein